MSPYGYLIRDFPGFLRTYIVRELYSLLRVFDTGVSRDVSIRENRHAVRELDLFLRVFDTGASSIFTGVFDTGVMLRHTGVRVFDTGACAVCIRVHALRVFTTPVRVFL